MSVTQLAFRDLGDLGLVGGLPRCGSLAFNDGFTTPAFQVLKMRFMRWMGTFLVYLGPL